jgi:hypothetical protein
MQDTEYVKQTQARHGQKYKVMKRRKENKGTKEKSANI